MREPTPDPLAWWRRALVDPSTPRIEDDPQAGFYARRAVKNGPLIPVQIHLRQEIDPDTGELLADEYFEAEELGRFRDPQWIWTHLRPLTADAFEALIERHRVDESMAATHVPFDITETPSRPIRR